MATFNARNTAGVLVLQKHFKIADPMNTIVHVEFGWDGERVTAFLNGQIWRASSHVGFGKFDKARICSGNEGAPGFQGDISNLEFFAGTINNFTHHHWMHGRLGKTCAESQLSTPSSPKECHGAALQGDLILDKPWIPFDSVKSYT